MAAKATTTQTTGQKTIVLNVLVFTKNVGIKSRNVKTIFIYLQ
ncbi:hypothetical protein Loa_00333 [Legionella oakridgensis ATCC 33761 = DSM 21215]|uniref:Uncharacterized protein n=1 Tax=Legionella oakridgensis ATCC 33761 = DSM 21215 TaxID=1268635 RepID=W0BBC9_9GAMM|nr:hypothetical protein Loa_00333 [Legionella oakridgensis ATCC 33761 = DSM 21215]ETO94297.1 hypothetical protein LOR_8c00560 [Legionella oakridgensis RV-2-2007]STY15853.1 Uncharacterised protein [Legionella longbeachae]